jgi:tetratricopeptide (TPR) repeat protein
MVAGLEEIRLRPYVSGWDVENRKAADRAYAAAFRNYGIDVEVLDGAEADRRVRESAIRDDLITALDDWAWLRQFRAYASDRPPPTSLPRVEPGEKKSPGWLDGMRQLNANLIFGPGIPSLGDSDEFRKRLRDRKVFNDREALEELARRPEAASLRPSTTLLLVRALTNAGAGEQGLGVLYAAQQRFPTDMGLNLQLAVHLERIRPEEALGFVRAALTTRPLHPTLHAQAGRLLLATGRPEQARAAYRRAFELGHDHVEGALEAELLLVSGTQRCRPLLQDMSFAHPRHKWSNGCQLFCRAGQGGYVELTVAISQPGQYALSVCFTKARDYGIVEVRLGGNPVGEPFDGYSPGVVRTGGVPLGIVELGPGEHRIRFTAVDKNAKSQNYFMGIDCLKLEPLN